MPYLSNHCYIGPGEIILLKPDLPEYLLEKDDDPFRDKKRVRDEDKKEKEIMLKRRKKRRH